MKKGILATAIGLSAVLCLTSCGEVKKAENTVNDMFTALKSSNIDDAFNYIDTDEQNNMGSNEELGKSLIKAISGNLNYTIISSEKNDSSNVIVKAEITSTDMKPVISDYVSSAMQYAFSYAFSDTQPSEEEQQEKMTELLIECASKPDLATVTNTVDIKVIKTDENKWKISADDALVNAIMGGFEDATDSIDSSLGSTE